MTPEQDATRWNDGIGDLEGSPFEFVFPGKVEDLDGFADEVFASAAPFRLCGLRQNMDDGRIKVLAVDLHGACTVDFEIGRSMTRAYLFGHNCGNVMPRLLTNLQARVDAGTYCPMMDEIAGSGPAARLL